MKIKNQKVALGAALAILITVLPFQTAHAQSIDDAQTAGSTAVETQEKMGEEGGNAAEDEGTADNSDMPNVEENGSQVQEAQEGGGQEAQVGPLTTMGDSNTISEGIYIGNINVSGKTAGEAKQDVEAYIEELKGQTVTFQVMDGNQVEAAVGDLGLKWANQDAVQDAIALGKKGNIIQRYKALQDLRHENKVFELAYDFDKEAIRKILAEQCMEYNTEAKDAVLTRTNGVFSVTPGQSGYVIDEEASVDQIYEYLMNEWDFKDVSVEVVAKVQEPRGTEEELLQVKDVLGTFTTSYSTSGSSRSANVSNGCNLIAGATLYPGDEFSTYEAVSPFSVDNGYFMAGSYMNGQVVDSLGGGICQVSTTLYNAVLLSELEVTERHNHSMIVTYVDPSADAAIAEGSKDFKFVNNLEYPVYIEGSTSNKHITFTIYGKETRASDREVRYESKVLEVNQPPADIIYPDPGQPIGYIVYDSAHVGYKAQLWKVVLEGGKEVSRTQVNSSSYKMVPRSATVGTATADPAAYEEIMAAIGTGSVDHVKNVIAILTAQAQAPVESPEIGDE